MTLLALLLAAAAPAFDVQVIPLQNPHAAAFFAPADGDAVPDLFVLDNQALTLYPSRHAASTTVVLPPGTSALDVFDLNGDGQVELLALDGDRMLHYPTADNAQAPVVLFEKMSVLAEPRHQPVLFAMGMTWNGQAAIALPGADAIHVVSLDGVPITAFPLDTAAVAGAGPARVSVRGIEPNQLGSGGTLELRVSVLQDVAPRLPEHVAPPPRATSIRPATLSQARDAAHTDSAAWPWFPLRTDAEGGARVLYALEPPEYRDTLIRVSPAVPEPDGAKPYRYPGALITYTEDALPDFNGDGHVDLFLWKAPLPGVSVDALTRAAIAGTWPLTTTIHLFAPEKAKYEARPMAPVRHQVPVAWFVTTEQGSPLRNVMFKDFNGDGKTDFACSTDPFSFAVWLFDQGFSQRPTFRHTSGMPLGRLETTVVHAPGKLVAMVFRSAEAVHVIRATY